MVDQSTDRTTSNTEDEAFLEKAKQFRHVLDRPFAVGFVAVAGAAIIFWLGIGVGDTAYRAFGGDDGAAQFGLALAAAIVVIPAITAWLGRHRHAHDDDRARTALRAFHPAMDRPVTVGFLAIALGLLLFRLGIGVGEILYAAFDGNTAAAAVFGTTLATTIAALVTLGVRLDRRRDARDDDGN